MWVGVGDQVDKESSKLYELPLVILRREEGQGNNDGLNAIVAGIVLISGIISASLR